MVGSKVSSAEPSTAEKALASALRLFANQGYKAVTMENIASAVGIKAPSLYKHFKSKDDLFDRILLMMEKEDAAKAEAGSVPVKSVGENEEAYENVSLDDLESYANEMFAYWTEDETAANFRRLLTIEQYKDERMAGLFAKFLGRGPVNYLADIFGRMPFVPDPQDAAVRLYAPMFFLFHVYDNAEDKKSVTGQARVSIAFVCNWLRQLRNNYGNENALFKK